MKLLRALFAATLVHAGLRFPCSTLTLQRLDPAGEPGRNPSAHVHHIVGGNAFNATMEGDVGERATCTTCHMAEDFSNYWTATLYFKDPTNGTYHRVPVMPVQPLLGGSDGAQGGLTVYYTQFDLGRDNLAQQPVKAFPPVRSMVFFFFRFCVAYLCVLRCCLDDTCWELIENGCTSLGIPHGRWQSRCQGASPCWAQLPVHVGLQSWPHHCRHAEPAVFRWHLYYPPLPAVSGQTLTLVTLPRAIFPLFFPLFFPFFFPFFFSPSPVQIDLEAQKKY